MAISFDLPDDVEQHLRSQFDNFELAAKEAMAVGLFRQGKLSDAQLAFFWAFPGTRPMAFSSGTT